jgi:ribosome-binding factor A
MASNRLTRVNELLKREIASAIYRVVNDPEFDFAAVTVTQVEASSDLRHARVFLSIRGADEARRAMLRQIRRHRRDFQEEVARNVVLKYNPHLRFELDRSVERGDRILHLISELDLPSSEEEDDAEDGFDAQ